MKYFSLFALLLFSISCSVQNQETMEPESNLLFENEKMVCYNISTKADGSEALIRLRERPELEIYCFDNPSTKADFGIYDKISYYVVDGKNALTVYSGFEAIEGRFIIRYNIVGIEEGVCSLEEVVTKVSLGNYTSDCLQDVYSKHGWASVLATVSTAFCPYTVCAFIGCCVSHYITERAWND